MNQDFDLIPILSEAKIPSKIKKYSLIFERLYELIILQNGSALKINTVA
jgi:hypothetical protein